jgi:60 kDa SS-A/Ro ribonucleoprotein
MARLNIKTPGADRRKDSGARLAGGMGMAAARQESEALLRRAVLGCLLWEDVAYESGEEVAANISALVPMVDAGVVADIAIEARVGQGLRHVPLLLARVMASLPTHRHVVGALLPEIIRRPDEITEFLAIYNRSNIGKRLPLSKQVKIGLAAAFGRFNEYSLAKWNRDGTFRLRDALFLTHPTPKDAEQAMLWAKLAADTLATPDTWEVILSGASSNGMSKARAWEKIIDIWIIEDAK